MESNTEQGQLATKMTIEKYNSLNNIVYVSCGGFDKFGRLLVDLFENKDFSGYLNYYLLDHPDPKLGPLAYHYEGKEKSEYAKNLPKIHK